MTLPPLPPPRLLPGRLLRAASALVGLVLFAAAVVVLGRELRGEKLNDVLAHVAAMPAWQPALALLFTAGSYLVLGGYDALSLRYVRRPLPYRRFALASFVNYAFGQALGFPLLTGGAVRLRLYMGWGLTAYQATSLMAFASFSFWLGVAALGGVVLLVDGRAAALLHLPPGVVRPIGALALLAVIAYLWWTARGPRMVRVRGLRVRRPSTGLAVRQLGVGCADWLLASSVLYVLLPPTLGVSYLPYVSVFLLAFVAGVVSNVPAGLGVFETVIVVLLPGHVPDAQLLGALVAYRAIYYLLPLAVAAAALGAYELRRRLRGDRVPGAGYRVAEGAR